MKLISNFLDLLLVFESKNFIDDFAFHSDFRNQVVYWSVAVNVNEWNVFFCRFLALLFFKCLLKYLHRNWGIKFDFTLIELVSFPRKNQ
jgi:hypothetical protein